MKAKEFIRFLSGLMERENVEDFTIQFDEVMSQRPPYDNMGIITIFVKGKTLQYGLDFKELDWDNIRGE